MDHFAIADLTTVSTNVVFESPIFAWPALAVDESLTLITGALPSFVFHGSFFADTFVFGVLVFRKLRANKTVARAWWSVFSLVFTRLAASDVAGAGDGEGILGTELALVALIIVVLSR